MMPVRRPQQWLPSIFNDFFDNNLMTRANATGITQVAASAILQSKKKRQIAISAVESIEP